MNLRYWLVGLLIITVVLRTPTMFSVERTGWDERAYAVFAKTVDEGGLSGIRKWLHDYPTNESLQRSPLLLRVGFIIPSMFVCKVLGGFTPDNLAWLSFAAGVGVVLLGAHFVEVIVGRRLAMLCGILLITSPLAAGLSRRGTQDTFTALIFLACLYFFHICWTRRTVFAHAALVFAMTLALLTKESAFVLYPLMLLAGLYYYRAMKLRSRYWLFVALVIAPVIYLLVEIWICNGVGNLLETYRTYVALQNKLEYTVHYEKGPWFRYVLDLVAIAPLVLICGIIGMSAPVEEPARHGRNLALIYLAGALLIFAQLPVMNVRLILFTDPFLRLAAVLGATCIASIAAIKWKRAIFFAILGVLVVSDCFQFYQIFVKGNVYSPTTFLLLRAEDFYERP